MSRHACCNLIAELERVFSFYFVARYVKNLINCFVWFQSGLIHSKAMPQLVLSRSDRAVTVQYADSSMQGYPVVIAKRYCMIAWVPCGSYHKYKHMNPLLQRTKQYQRKVLLSSFHLDGNTTDSIVRTTFYSTINSPTVKCCPVALLKN